MRRNVGADELTPHIIYTVLKASTSIPNLHSNIQYMSDYSNTEYQEGQYYLTQVMAAVHFLETTPLDSLLASLKKIPSTDVTRRPESDKPDSFLGDGQHRNSKLVLAHTSLMHLSVEDTFRPGSPPAFSETHLPNSFAPASPPSANAPNLNRPYFYGDMSGADADRLLLGCAAGTFLIRDSSRPGHYAVQVVKEDGSFAKALIRHDDSGCALTDPGSTVYPSLDALVGAQPNVLRFPYVRGETGNRPKSPEPPRTVSMILRNTTSEIARSVSPRPTSPPPPRPTSPPPKVAAAARVAAPAAKAAKAAPKADGRPMTLFVPLGEEEAFPIEEMAKRQLLDEIEELRQEKAALLREVSELRQQKQQLHDIQLLSVVAPKPQAQAQPQPQPQPLVVEDELILRLTNELEEIAGQIEL